MAKNMPISASKRKQVLSRRFSYLLDMSFLEHCLICTSEIDIEQRHSFEAGLVNDHSFCDTCWYDIIHGSDKDHTNYLEVIMAEARDRC